MTLALLADLAQILAEAFLEPDADLKESLERVLASDPGPALAKPLRRMVKHSLGPTDQAVEYARLFLQARDSEVVHLFESVQARGHHMAPEILLPLQAIYEAADLSVQEALATPPDHLGLELACLGYLLAQVIEGEPADPAPILHLARRLLDDHLEPFLRQVGAQLPQVSARPYYLAASDLASVLVVEVRKALVEIQPTAC